MPHGYDAPADDGPRQVRRRTVVEAPPADVWRAITDPDELATWWGRGSTLDANPGGVGRLVDPDGTVRVGVVIAVDDGRRLLLDWWPEDDDDQPATRVAIELTPCPFGTVVTITESVLVDMVVHPPVLLRPPTWRAYRPWPSGGWLARATR